MTEKEQEERGTEHFREILNRQPPEENADILVAASDLNINTVVPEKEEIIKAIKSFKNGKAPKHDNLKHSSSRQTQSLQQPFYSYFLKLYGRERKCQLTGQRESSSGYQRRERSATATTAVWIIIKQISDALDAGMRKEQKGFRK